MDYIFAIILGAAQGFTEFLPVSSSGHLVLLEYIFNLDQPGVLFEAILHAGTAFAVLFFLRDKLLKFTLHDAAMVAVGSIPAGLVGVLFSDQIEGLFSIAKLVGFMFLITAFLNWRTDKFRGTRENIDVFDALLVGVFQAVAIIPGISRSGSTIFAGSKANLSKAVAAQYSFLLSVPAILGANIVQIIKHGADGDFSFSLAIVGFLAAFISGIVAIRFLMRLLTERKLKIFSYYLVILGIVTILFL